MPAMDATQFSTRTENNLRTRAFNLNADFSARAELAPPHFCTIQNGLLEEHTQASEFQKASNVHSASHNGPHANGDDAAQATPSTRTGKK
jgi:hypothetical protein